MKSFTLTARIALLARFLLLVGFLLGSLAPAQSQTMSTGTIEGRVLDARRGEFLEKSRITVEGTKLEVLTDATGNYRLTNVPVGSAKIVAFYTGLGSISEVVVVAGGQTVQHLSLIHI